MQFIQQQERRKRGNIHPFTISEKIIGIPHSPNSGFILPFLVGGCLCVYGGGGGGEYNKVGYIDRMIIHNDNPNQGFFLGEGYRAMRQVGGEFRAHDIHN